MKHFGKFNITIERENGSKEETGFVDNLFLNKYFNLSQSADDFNYLYILFGSGSTAPTLLDTSLENTITDAYLSSSRKNMGGSLFEKTYDASTKVFTQQYTITFTGTKGKIQGNISEIGLSYGSKNTGLFTRALVKNTQGTPTTLSVGPNDVLSIVYIIGYQMDFTNDLLDSKIININGQDTTVKLHALGYNRDEWPRGGQDPIWMPRSTTDSNGQQINWSCYDSGVVTYSWAVTGSLDFEKGKLTPGSSILHYIGHNAARGTGVADGTHIVRNVPSFSVPAGRGTGTWNAIIFCGSSEDFETKYAEPTVALTFDPPLIKGEADEFIFNNISFKCGRT